MPEVDIKYRIHDAQIIGYENKAPAVTDLSIGDGVKLDAVLTRLPVAKAFVDAGYPVKIMGEPLLFTYASVALDHSSKRDVKNLLEEINNIITELHKTGLLGELSVQYQRQDLTREAAQYDISALNQIP